LRIDARTGRLSSIHLGNLLLTSAFAAHGIVAVTAMSLPTIPPGKLGPRVLRIGLADELLSITDPAVARAPAGTGRWQWQLHHAVCAELYTHPDGADSQALEPELASGPARASPDERTWTIPIRTDFRFSPPLNRAVTAEDVRATIIRAVSPELGPPARASSVLREVVGLAAYRHGRADDVSGIGLHHGTLQITTRRPVRDLPARLALPYFCVLPAGTPAPPSGYDEPLPTAGPYYLAEHSGGSLALLQPNPGYRGTRPRHLSAIVFRINVARRRGVAGVRNGQLDFYDASTSAVLRPVTIGPRVGCRSQLVGVPGLDLAALCLHSAAG
jgi:ABC-type transport system substrate-binding protein